MASLLNLVLASVTVGISVSMWIRCREAFEDEMERLAAAARLKDRILELEEDAAQSESDGDRRDSSGSSSPVPASVQSDGDGESKPKD